MENALVNRRRSMQLDPLLHLHLQVQTQTLRPLPPRPLGLGFDPLSILYKPKGKLKGTQKGTQLDNETDTKGADTYNQLR